MNYYLCELASHPVPWTPPIFCLIKTKLLQKLIDSVSPTRRGFFSPSRAASEGSAIIIIDNDNEEASVLCPVEMSSPTMTNSGQVAPISILSPAPMLSSGTSLTVSTTTNLTNHHDPSNLRRQATPVAPAPRVPVETTKIVKTQDSKNPTWKMLNQYRVMRLLGRGTHGIVKYGEDMSKDDPNAPNYAVVSFIVLGYSPFMLISSFSFRPSKSSSASQIAGDSPGQTVVTIPIRRWGVSSTRSRS